MMKLQWAGKHLAIALGLLAPWTSPTSAVGQTPQRDTANVVRSPDTAGPDFRDNQTRAEAAGSRGGDDARPENRRGETQVRPDGRDQDQNRVAQPPRTLPPQPWGQPYRPRDAGQPRTPFSPLHQDQLSQQVESLDRVLYSDIVRRILELKEENLELKAAMKILEVQLGARQEIAELQTKMLREEAERAQDSARRIQGEMELKSRELHARSEEAEMQARRSAEQFERARQIPKEQAQVHEEMHSERQGLAKALAELEKTRAEQNKYEAVVAELKQMVTQYRQTAEQLKQELVASHAGRAELDHRIRTLDAKLEEAESKLNASKRESAKQTEGAKKEVAKRKQGEDAQESKSLKKDSDKKDSDKKDSDKKDSDKKDSDKKDSEIC